MNKCYIIFIQLMNVFDLISLQKEKELIEYIKREKDDILNEIEENDYNGK